MKLSYDLEKFTKTCYRVEINQRSRYFKNKKDAFSYFINQIGLEKNVELWVLNYSYSTIMGVYIATQTLLDYYTAKRKV